MKNNITKQSPTHSKNESVNRKEVENLIVGIFEHPDSPEWLLDAMWEAINEHSTIPAYDPDYVRTMLKFADFDAEKRGENDAE